MILNGMNQNSTIEHECSAGVVSAVTNEARILIVGDDDTYTEQLKRAFAESGFVSENARNITDGCNAAKSGRFQVVVTVPSMRDGSWQRLVDVANHYNLNVEVILLARNFDLAECASALDHGAFDVLNVPNELRNVGRVATSAFWAAYLRGSGRLPQSLCKSQSIPSAA
jgi:DNA-binding NtrC family response regulator